MLQPAMIHATTLSPSVAQGCNLCQQSGNDGRVIYRTCDIFIILHIEENNLEALLFSTPTYFSVYLLDLLFQDRDALVDLMIDFVEAMNPEVKFNRQFSVLKDRDLTGELKDIWLAIQVKREKEKEKAENGRKLETQEKHKGEVKTSEHGQESESYWLETDRSKKLGLEVVESETRNIVLPHNETKLQGNSIIEGPTTPSPKNSPTHQRKSKIRSSKGELFTQTVQHYDRKSGGDSNIDVHVSEFCTVTKQTVFREIFPSSSDSSEDEDRGDFRLSNSPANSIKLHDGDLGMDDGPSIGTNSTHKSVSVEEASSPGNSDVEAHNVKPCKFLRMKSSSVKKSIEKQGKQSVHVANKFKNHDKGDCDTVARF
ncbi:hypothetical protein C0J52_22949 [Blattella germanica]|nr:hypothetical protein C0J52_22949 [Blattella germanica]